MKKRISLFIALIISCSLFSQNAHSIAVAPSMLNIIYVGVDNPVDIAVFGVKQEEISVSISYGTIKRIGNGRYIVKVNKPGPGSTRITVHKGETYLGNKQFRCKLVPDPYACVRVGGGRIKTGSVSKLNLLNQIGVFAELEWDFDVRFQIIEFIVKAQIGESDYKAKSSSYKFSAEQKDIIRKLPYGSELTIEEIKCIGPDSVVRNLNPIVLKIK